MPRGFYMPPDSLLLGHRYEQVRRKHLARGDDSFVHRDFNTITLPHRDIWKMRSPSRSCSAEESLPPSKYSRPSTANASNFFIMVLLATIEVFGTLEAENGDGPDLPTGNKIFPVLIILKYRRLFNPSNHHMMKSSWSI